MKCCLPLKFVAIIFLIYIFLPENLLCQFGELLFLDDFGKYESKREYSDWKTYSGDGKVVSDFSINDKHALFTVDASNDNYNVWWAIIKKEFSPNLQISSSLDSQMEIRVEASIKVSHAPRRVNLHFNTSRTTDYHTHSRYKSISYH